MGEPALLHLKVRHYEVDSYGHVNHANYVHYLETARVEALEAVGLPLAEMRRQGYLIFATDLSIKYRSPAQASETLEIITYIRDIRGARSLFVQEVREAGSQRVVATAYRGLHDGDRAAGAHSAKLHREALGSMYYCSHSESGPRAGVGDQRLASLVLVSRPTSRRGTAAHGGVRTPSMTTPEVRSIVREQPDKATQPPDSARRADHRR